MVGVATLARKAGGGGSSRLLFGRTPLMTQRIPRLTLTATNNKFKNIKSEHVTVTTVASITLSTIKVALRRMGVVSSAPFT
jgi:hypothetical protein